MAFPPLTRQSVDNCAFVSWHETFRRHTPKATVLQLPDEFLRYLESDGIYVPEGSDFER
jgi:hypothetical protein